MIESGYFPAGAEFDPQAPYNEPLVPNREFGVCISQSLSKNLKVKTNSYVSEKCVEPWNGICEEKIDTSDTNWAEEYHNDSHYTPLQLIGLFRRHLSDELNVILNTPSKDIKRKKYLEGLIEECSGWIDDETVIMEN